MGCGGSKAHVIPDTYGPVRLWLVKGVGLEDEEEIAKLDPILKEVGASTPLEFAEVLHHPGNEDLLPKVKSALSRARQIKLGPLLELMLKDSSEGKTIIFIAV